MFGDNKAVATNATIPISTLSKPTLLSIIGLRCNCSRISPVPLQQDISCSIGKMGNPILPTSLANIGDSLVSGLFYNLFFSGGEIHLNLPPKSKGSDRIPIKHDNSSWRKLLSLGNDQALITLTGFNFSSFH